MMSEILQASRVVLLERNFSPSRFFFLETSRAYSEESVRCAIREVLKDNPPTREDMLAGWIPGDLCPEAEELVRLSGLVEDPDSPTGWRLDDACAEAAERVRANSC